MDLDLVFLGTSASMPTQRRSTSALLVRRGGDRLLFDCGEGTQRQLLVSAVGLIDLREIFLTHYHADHFLGLPGLLKTFALRGRDVPLTVYGPPGLRDLFGSLRRIFGRLTYELALVELEPGETLERGDHRIEAFATDHGVTSIGYALAEDDRPGRFDVELAERLGVPFGPERGILQRGGSVVLADGRAVTAAELVGPARRGRRLVITGDTAPSPRVIAAAAGAGLLVHEATFGEDERDRALETGHSTARDAAEVAATAGVALLALTHVSARYFGPELVREAREAFAETVCPRDFDTIEIPFPERGQPSLVRGGAQHDAGAPRPERTANASKEGAA